MKQGNNGELVEVKLGDGWLAEVLDQAAKQTIINDAIHSYDDDLLDKLVAVVKEHTFNPSKGDT